MTRVPTVHRGLVRHASGPEAGVVIAAPGPHGVSGSVPARTSSRRLVPASNQSKMPSRSTGTSPSSASTSPVARVDTSVVAHRWVVPACSTSACTSHSGHVGTRASVPAVCADTTRPADAVRMAARGSDPPTYGKRVPSEQRAMGTAWRVRRGSRARDRCWRPCSRACRPGRSRTTPGAREPASV